MPGAIDEDLIPQLVADLSTVEEDNAPPDELKAAVARLESITAEEITLHRATAVLTNHDPDERVRAALYISRIRPADDVTRDELVEVLRRAYPDSDLDEARRQAYMEIFDVNVPLPGAWALIFHPPKSRVETICEYDPTPEQIVEWIFDPDDISLLS